MDKETKPKADLLHLVAWADANRKRLIIVAAVIVAAGAIIGIYVWHGNAREADANAALSQLAMPGTVRATEAATEAAKYAQLADTYAETSAGARAMLVGGAMYFDAGQPAKARPLFERYLHDHADYPLTGQALIGLAACLEAEGKTAEAIASYQKLLNTRPSDAAVPQAKAALAHLYVMTNKPELALRLYQELLNMNSSWAAEAQIRANELVANNPSLRQPPPGSAPGPAAAPTTNEALMIPGVGH